MTKKLPLERRLLLNAIYEKSIFCFSLFLLLPLGFILFYIIKQGFSAFSWEFFTSLPKPVGEVGGGVSNAIIGSLLLVGIAACIAIPFGLFIGIYLAEFPHKLLSKWVKTATDTLQGIPSVVIGIIAYTWVVIPLGSFSAFSGSFALALIMLPLVINATEESVKLIPDTLKEASYALGAPYYKTILKVVIPSSFNGILSGILLGIARICGETAPLLFTAFGSPFMNVNVMKSVNSLPLLIFNYATSPYEDWQRLAWGASLLLIFFVLLLSIFAKIIKRQS